MAVHARMKDGTVRRLAAKMGATPAEVAVKLTEPSLLGSAQPFSDHWVEMDDGALERYSNIDRLEPFPD